VNRKNSSVILSITYLLNSAINTAFAEGGLDKVNTFMDNVLTVLRGGSIAVVTIAIMWSGYKFLFKNAELSECTKILGGGLLIGGATEIARYLIGG
jgi:type IV secretory pathway VirB2 component (pilin)